MVRQHFCARLLLLACVSFCGTPPALAAEQAFRVFAEQGWTDTGFDVVQGRPLPLRARGQARLFARHVLGPEGTYRWPKRYRAQGAFALPTMAQGPAPAFCLLGRIGTDGTPFVIGRQYDGVAPASGRLWLGVNDDHLYDNDGYFDVTLAAFPAVAAQGPAVIHPGTGGAPVPKARVLLLYVDGLLPDVLREMAQDGYLPNFQRVFLDNGLQVPDAFTVFPSNTLVANGALFTGLFPDGTGIKSQNQFERSTLKTRGQLSRWLPDGFMPQPATDVINLLDKFAPENTHAFLTKRGIPTLAGRLGPRFGFTTLPIAPLNPPPSWLHWAINTIGPFGLAARLPGRLDEVNIQYALHALIGDPDLRVAAIWLPMVDKTCHHSGYGQFGAARRDLALADDGLGQILARLRQVGWLSSTYMILISDHGHLGGERGVNRRCNLPRDWAHRLLGCNAHVVGQEWTHPGIPADRFLFFDNQGAGQAALFLPYRAYFQGPWRRNRLFELMDYEIRPGQRVNVLESLRAFRPEAWRQGEPSPVDLMLVKLDENRTLVYRDPGTQAILSRVSSAEGAAQYRYEPIQRIRQSSDGEIAFDAPQPGQDPLGYLQDAAFLAATGGASWIAQAHTASEWLDATRQTRYPDAVIGMARYFAWSKPVADLAAARDPDVLLTAAEGWSFRSDDGEGTDHGHPLSGSMRITMALSGPNLRRGIWPRAQRIVDVMPTILELIGEPYDPATVDGQALTGLYADAL